MMENPDLIKASMDLNYAPPSYFSNIDLETKIKSKITGQIRKELVTESTKTKFTHPYILSGKISSMKISLVDFILKIWEVNS